MMKIVEHLITIHIADKVQISVLASALVWSDRESIRNPLHAIQFTDK